MSKTSVRAQCSDRPLCHENSRREGVPGCSRCPSFSTPPLPNFPKVGCHLCFRIFQEPNHPSSPPQPLSPPVPLYSSSQVRPFRSPCATPACAPVPAEGRRWKNPNISSPSAQSAFGPVFLSQFKAGTAPGEPPLGINGNGLCFHPSCTL